MGCRCKPSDGEGVTVNHSPAWGRLTEFSRARFRWSVVDERRSRCDLRSIAWERLFWVILVSLVVIGSDKAESESSLNRCIADVRSGEVGDGAAAVRVLTSPEVWLIYPRNAAGECFFAWRRPIPPMEMGRNACVNWSGSRGAPRIVERCDL